MLNAKLLADCRHDESRIMAGRTESVGTLLLTEKEHLLPLPVDGLRSGRGELSACRSGRMREGADELLLRAAEAGHRLSRLASTPAWLSSGRTAYAVASMSAATIARRRSSIWNIISMCWTGSLARCADRSRWPSGGHRDDGRRAMTGSGS